MKERPFYFLPDSSGKEKRGVNYCDLEVKQGVTLKNIPGVSLKFVAWSDGHIYGYSNARVNSRNPQPFRVLESIGSAEYHKANEG